MNERFSLPQLHFREDQKSNSNGSAFHYCYTYSRGWIRIASTIATMLTQIDVRGHYNRDRNPGNFLSIHLFIYFHPKITYQFWAVTQVTVHRTSKECIRPLHLISQNAHS